MSGGGAPPWETWRPRVSRYGRSAGVGTRTYGVGCKRGRRSVPLRRTSVKRSAGGGVLSSSMMSRLAI